MERLERCDKCRFWDHDGADTYSEVELDMVDEYDWFSECHRFPPPSGSYHDVDEHFTAQFPITRGTDWCGEFVPVLDAPPDR